MLRKAIALAAVTAVLAIGPPRADAGSFFLTGHDPDFHAALGPNTTGARNLNVTAITYVMDPLFNPLVATAPKFLFVESSIAPPIGHATGKNGIVASGYVEGVHFDHADAATLNAALDLLGDAGGYSAIVVTSDYGGVLTQAELDILNSRQADIAAFLNSGGGLYAMAETNHGEGLTPGGGWFGFVPVAITAPGLDQNENGFSVTAFGATLGLTNADVNGNYSHGVFTGLGGLTAVDVDAAGNVLSIAGRQDVVPVQKSTWGGVKSLIN